MGHSEYVFVCIYLCVCKDVHEKTRKRRKRREDVCVRVTV